MVNFIYYIKLLCYDHSSWFHVGYMQGIKLGYWVLINVYMVTIYALHVFCFKITYWLHCITAGNQSSGSSLLTPVSHSPTRASTVITGMAKTSRFVSFVFPVLHWYLTCWNNHEGFSLHQYHQKEIMVKYSPEHWLTY